MQERTEGAKMLWTVEVPSPVVSFELDADTEEEAIETARESLIEWAQSADLTASLPL